MVRQVNKNIGSWLKPLLVIIVAGGGLLWHLLACTESPMAFSPDGKTLAFVTMEPYEADDLQRVGEHAFRLMTITEQQELKVIEETDQFMFSAPAFSPDGKSFCYLRVPLMTEEIEKYFKESFQQKQKMLDEVTKESSEKEPPELSVPSSDQPDDTVDLILPPLEMTHQLWNYVLSAKRLPAVLVVRDTESYAEKSRILVEMPVSEGSEIELFMTYLTARSQYSPDGQWIYLGAGFAIRAINPDTRQVRFLAGPVVAAETTSATVVALSPDGKNIATMLGDEKPILGLFQTDGSKAIYTRLAIKPSFSGLLWTRENTLAVLSADPNKVDDQTVILHLDFFRADGSLLNSLKMQVPQSGKKEKSRIDIDMGELALSADGKYMVIAYMEDVYFMTSSGKLLYHHHKNNKEILVQPTFTPDGKLLAFKRFVETKDEYPRVLSIDYYTPQGKKVKSVEVPRSKLATAMMEKKEKEKENKKSPPKSKTKDTPES
jgi:hypothetical protein